VQTRGLDSSEVYYELIDRIWPMNILCVLELDGAVTTSAVAEAWARSAERVPVVGARVERTSPRDAHFVFGPDGATGTVATYDDLPTALAAEGRTPIELATGPLARCSVVEHAERATVVIAVHHAALDGRGLAQLALLFARVLLDGDDVSGHPLTSATLPLGELTVPEHSWASRRGEMLATAREIRSEDGYVDNAVPLPWHDPALEAEREIGFVPFRLTTEETADLIGWSRTHDATVHGALSAAVLRTVALLTPRLPRTALSTTVDLRARALAPERGSIGQAAAVIAASYGDPADAGATARAVSADVRRRVDRGEGELFFALSGADRLPVGEESDKVVRQWTGNATPSVCLSNLGVVRGAAPDALRGLTFGLAPTPNQVAFVFAATFRGRTSFTVGFDRSRLAIDPETLAETLRLELVALVGAAPGAGR